MERKMMEMEKKEEQNREEVRILKEKVKALGKEEPRRRENESNEKEENKVEENENEEIKEKRENIVIFGLAESESKNETKSKEEDKQKIEDIMRCIGVETEGGNTEIWRTGKKTNERERPRPL